MIEPVIVIDSVGDVGILLGLKDKKTALNSVNRTRIYLNEISLMNSNLTDKLAPLAISDHLLQLISCLCIVADYERCTLRSIEHIPALLLTKRAIFILKSILIVRMNLD